MTMDRATMTGTSTTARTKRGRTTIGIEMIQFGIGRLSRTLSRSRYSRLQLASNWPAAAIVHLTHFAQQRVGGRKARR